MVRGDGSAAALYEVADEAPRLPLHRRHQAVGQPRRVLEVVAARRPPQQVHRAQSARQGDDLHARARDGDPVQPPPEAPPARRDDHRRPYGADRRGGALQRPHFGLLDEAEQTGLEQGAQVLRPLRGATRNGPTLPPPLAHGGHARHHHDVRHARHRARRLHQLRVEDRVRARGDGVPFEGGAAAAAPAQGVEPPHQAAARRAAAEHVPARVHHARRAARRPRTVQVPGAACWGAAWCTTPTACRWTTSGSCSSASTSTSRSPSSTASCCASTQTSAAASTWTSSSSSSARSTTRRASGRSACSSPPRRSRSSCSSAASTPATGPRRARRGTSWSTSAAAAGSCLKQATGLLACFSSTSGLDEALDPDDLSIAVERRGAHTSGIRGALRLSAYEARRLAMLVAPENKMGKVGAEEFSYFFSLVAAAAAGRSAGRPLGGRAHGRHSRGVQEVVHQRVQRQKAAHGLPAAARRQSSLHHGPSVGQHFLKQRPEREPRAHVQHRLDLRREPQRGQPLQQRVGDRSGGAAHRRGRHRRGEHVRGRAVLGVQRARALVPRRRRAPHLRRH